MRVPYCTDIVTEAGFVMTDVECKLDVCREDDGSFSVYGVTTRGGKSLLALERDTLDFHIGYELADRAERDLKDYDSALFKAVDEAASFEEEVA